MKAYVMQRYNRTSVVDGLLSLATRLLWWMNPLYSVFSYREGTGFVRRLSVILDTTICVAAIGSLSGCALSKPTPPIVSMSPVLAAQEADEQCTTYGLKDGSPAYFACAKRAADKLLYNNAVAICGQKSFFNQCGSGIMSSIDPTPAQSLEITECKQRMYNLCVQSATQEYLENQAVNPFG